MLVWGKSESLKVVPYLLVQVADTIRSTWQ